MKKNKAIIIEGDPSVIIKKHNTKFGRSHKFKDHLRLSEIP